MNVDIRRWNVLNNTDQIDFHSCNLTSDFFISEKLYRDPAGFIEHCREEITSGNRS